jgi:hypothetical protein
VQNLVGTSARCAGSIAACYAAEDNSVAYSDIDLTPFGFVSRDVILADELGFHDVPVGLLAEDPITEEIWEIYRGTRVVVNGPNEWKVDGQVWLNPCPFAPGCRTHTGFTSTEATFHLLSGKPFPTPQNVTGHSLAAAWGLLRAARLRCNLISFAGPKAGDREFAEFSVQAIPFLLRWVHHPDVVPKVPIEFWPLFEYMHGGPANEFDSSAQLNQALSLEDRVEAYHSIDVYWNAVDPKHPIPARFLP